ncbi:MAG: FeoB-associated Cys-rich membrane protein [Treponema sp.]|nr:FeoB-associated Cys-rich membrane protein [Treponema sp.]
MLGTVIVGLLLAALVGAIIFSMVRKAKKGGCSCGCSCACGSSSVCGSCRRGQSRAHTVRDGTASRT